MGGWLTTFVDQVRPFLASAGGPVAMIQIENELSCGTGIYTNWAIDTAVKLNTGIPWSFCNNSGSCNLPDTPGVVFTANAGVGPDKWFDQGMYGHYASQPAIWSEVEQGFTEWNGESDDETRLSGLAQELTRWYSKGGGGHSLYMFNGGNNYGWTAGDDDTTKYAPYACVEPVLQRPNEPTYSHIKKLYGVLHEHTALLLGQDAPNPTQWAGEVGASPLEVRTYTNSTCSLTFAANLGDTPAPYLGGITVPAHGTMLISHVKGAAPVASYNTEDCASSVQQPLHYRRIAAHLPSTHHHNVDHLNGRSY